MQHYSGTFTAAAAGQPIALSRGECFQYRLVVQPTEIFSGTVQLQRSRDRGATWQPVDDATYDGTGSALDDTTDLAITLANEDDGRVWYRLVNLVASGDDGIEWHLTEIRVARRQILPGVEEVSAVIVLDALDLVGKGLGQLGHADGVVLAPAPRADQAIELASVVLAYAFAVAAFTGGDDTLAVSLTSGREITTEIPKAELLGGAASAAQALFPDDLALTSYGQGMDAGEGMNLVVGTAFTQPGTAAGSLLVRVRYYVHTLSVG